MSENVAKFEFYSRASEARNAIEDVAEKILEQWGAVAEGHAVQTVHVISGRLKNSITHAVDISDYSVSVGTNVEYAKDEECGNSRRPPHPYLKPAVANHFDEYKLIAMKELKK